MISRPVLEAILGIALLSAMDALIKGLLPRYPVAEIAFIRYVVGSLAMLACLALLRPGSPQAESLRANGTRAVLVVVTALTFFFGIGQLPLAEALILSFVSPVFTAFFAALLLRERLDLRTASALVAGFAGVVTIVMGKAGENGQGASDILGGSLLGVGAILLSSVTYAASNVLLRARAQRDPVLVIVAIQNMAPCLMLAGPAFYFGRVPASGDGPALALLGVLGVGGHLLLARAYAQIQAVKLAPLDYTALIWAILIGYLAFDEVPQPAALLGAVLIVSGAWLASRQRQSA